MTSTEIVFYLFGGLAILGSFGVATARNPLHGAVWLLLALFAVAGLFACAGAHFLAAMQVLVYAGAVTVLFVFVIMLLNLSEKEIGDFRMGPQQWVALILFLVLLAGLIGVGSSSRFGFPEVTAAADPGSTQAMGELLLTEWVAPFEVISLLLLAAMAGAVMLTKRAHAEDSIAAITRARVSIDRRVAQKAFVTDPALPDQHGLPVNQLPPAADSPETGVKARAFDPGETV